MDAKMLKSRIEKEGNFIDFIYIVERFTWDLYSKNKLSYFIIEHKTDNDSWFEAHIEQRLNIKEDIVYGQYIFDSDVEVVENIDDMVYKLISLEDTARKIKSYFKSLT
jgi:hypothetical protein